MNRDEMNFENLLNQAEVKDFLHRAERDMFPKMKGSAMSLVINDDKPDAKLALEVGAAILFDKPLLVVVPRGSAVSAALRRVATKVIEIDDFSSPDAQVKLQCAIDDVLKRETAL